MATCCSLRKLNYTSAIFFLLFGFLGFLSCLLFFAVPKNEEFWEELGETKAWSYACVSLFTIYTFAVFISSILLIVGLKKNRRKYMTPFIYVIYTGIAFTLAVSVRLFFRGLKKKQPVGELVVELLIDVAVCGFQGLLLYPVYRYYKDIKSRPYLPEQHTLNGNEPINKPNYPLQGQA
ncbi:uncharacterized protein LOC131801716 [Musca domestica]|uniref:Uncharacterized protein LOC131801716 n=1 Tax=Musca domestica TaxID=7370 RepID=A0ABM3USZ9_MUSDO|nr:uncharacterized protein LOC131801716 [Musca domestica]